MHAGADTRDPEAAWNRYSVAREKATFATASFLICLLVPVWGAFDLYLEPALAPQFIALRLLDVAITAAIWQFIARSSDLRKNRLAMSLSVMAVGLMIIAMLPQVRMHYALYTFGFSLVFWGAGVLLIWPLPYAAWTFGTLLSAHVLVHFVVGDRVSNREFVGSLFYLGSAAFIAGAQLVVRRRLEHDAFRATFTLESRNAELASTVEALGATQARLLASSAALSESLDLMATAQRVTQIAVPNFATWAFLVGAGPRAIPTLAAEHVDPERRTALLSALTSVAAPPRHGARVAQRFVSVTPEVLTRVAGERVSDVLSANSLITAPLVARGEQIGLLVLGRTDRDYEPNEVAFAEEIAHRAALALDNARLFRQAEDAVRLRDEFISIAGHELRTPLTALQLNVDRLLRHQPQEAARPHLLRVNRQVDRMTDLIGQLLDVSKITAGRLALECADMDLVELVREVAERFHEQADKAGSAIELRLPVAARGCWDQARLDQVISNLISNALKYGAGKPIQIALERVERGFALTIADQGLGISSADQDRIFERFERAVSAAHYGGFGLGLWIARIVVEASGGTISVQSELSRGSKFTVVLPSS